MNATTLVSETDRQAIEKRIGEIEQTTTAELVVAVATESGRYDRAESIIGIITALVALGIAHLFPSLFRTAGDWAESNLNILFQSLAVVVGFVIGNYLAVFFLPLRRLFVGKEEQARETDKAASYIFCNHKLNETEARNGVLIYLSVFERRIVILADQSCKNGLGMEKIQEICSSTIEKLKAGNYRDAILLALDQLSTQLTASLPATRQLAENELSDRVLVFHRSV